MKKNTLIVLLLFAFSFTAAQNAKYYSPKVQSAIVYLNGATLTQTAKVNLLKGSNEIILTNLAHGIDEKSIKVKIKGNAFVVSVNKMLNHIRKNKKSKEVLKLTDSLNFYEKKRSDLNAEIQVLQGKSAVLSSLIQKGSKNFSISQIKKSLDFFTKQSSKINYSLEKDKTIFQKVMGKIQDIKKQIKELGSFGKEPVNEVGLTIQTSKKTTAVVKVSYFTRSASWKPFYNIASSGFGEPISLTLNADIRQRTGLEWKNIQLTVSTRNPYLNNNKPLLKPWFIGFRKNHPIPMFKAMNNVQAEAVQTAAPSYIVQQSKGLAIEYKLMLNVPIPPDGKGRIVKIKNVTLPAEYSYYAVPKYSNEGFLVCKIKDWKRTGFLSGQANIFYENSYVGKSFVNPKTTDKDFLLSLGKDINIRADKKLVKDFREESFLGNNVTRTFNYEIILKNNKEKTCPLIVEDQIPISKNEKIKVKVIETSNAAYSPRSGKLVWKLKLKPGEKKILKLNFSVTYPGDKEISGL